MEGGGVGLVCVHSAWTGYDSRYNGARRKKLTGFKKRSWLKMYTSCSSSARKWRLMFHFGFRAHKATNFGGRFFGHFPLVSRTVGP